jgi:hypothetical protein
MNHESQGSRSAGQVTASAIRTALILASLVMLSGCSKKYFEWTEDVQLSDGTTVKVERTVRYGKVLRELGGPTSAWISQATVTIVDKGKQLPTWSHPMQPFILDKEQETGRWILIASAMDYCEYASRFGPPYPTFPAFVLDVDKWRYVSLPDSAVGRKANLLLGVPGGSQPKHLTNRDVDNANWRNLPDLVFRTVSTRTLGLCARDLSSKRKVSK